MALVRPDDGLVGPVDQLVPRLGQDLDRDVVGDGAVLDDLADEVEVGVGGGGKPDLDLLEADLDELVEHHSLAVGVHRLDERLVAVAQIDTAPQWRLVGHGVGPGPVGDGDAGVLLVLLDWH